MVEGLKGKMDPCAPLQTAFVVVVKGGHELRGSVLHHCFAEVLGPSVGQDVSPRHVVDVFRTLLAHLFPYLRTQVLNLGVSAASALFECSHFFDKGGRVCGGRPSSSRPRQPLDAREVGHQLMEGPVRGVRLPKA
eukprot:1046191-Prorocentrum_minimum.AAC.2